MPSDGGDRALAGGAAHDFNMLTAIIGNALPRGSR